MTDKERLEEIDKVVDDLLNNRGELTNFVNDYYLQAERVQELEELKNAFDDLDRDYIDLQEQNKRYREAREIIEQVYKENYVKDAYGYEDGYLDGLDTAMSIIDEALEELK